MVMKNTKNKKKDNLSFVPKKSEWISEVLRLTAFMSSAPNKPEKWWESVVSTQPFQSTTRPFYSDVGTFKNGLLQLTIQSERIDWIYTPDPNKSYDLGISNIGSFNIALKDFISIMQKWFSLAPEIKRLAFGANLLHIENDQVEGYKYFDKYLSKSIKLDAEESSDFMYQINRPRFSNLSDFKELKINRVSRWLLLILNKIEFSISSQGASLTPDEKSLLTTSRLEIDINTDPKFNGVFPHDKIKLIFNELVQLGVEITEQGDIK